MARVRLKRKKFSMPGRYILLILTILCIAMMLLTYFTDAVSGPLSYVAAYTIVPIESGLNTIGERFKEHVDNFQSLEAVLSENKALKEQVEELSQEKNNLIEDKYELTELRNLYDLDDKFSDYEKVGARVIGKDPGNWFSVFLIDKGTDDGLKVDMNVIAGNGLVGIITEVGPNWATVRSVIDDASNVSSMVLSTSDTCMVSGDLKLMESGEIRFDQLTDDEDVVVVGDEIVTSNISNKFLPNITIGYISSLDKDANNLTKSGTLTPAVDFKHINTVLVITELKNSGSEQK